MAGVVVGRLADAVDRTNRDFGRAGPQLAKAVSQADVLSRQIEVTFCKNRTATFQGSQLTPLPYFRPSWSVEPTDRGSDPESAPRPEDPPEGR